jgi:protein-S-isoprenylcysteine O-methyltransferase Ste14
MAALNIIQAPWRRLPRPRIAFEATLRRATIKWLGVMAGTATIFLAWLVLPEYARGSYQPLFDAARCLLPYFPVVCALWILYSEWRLGPEEDDAWHSGLAILGHWRAVKWKVVGRGALGWLVRGFFLPLNFCALVAFLRMFRGVEAEALSGLWLQVQNTLILMLSALLAAAIVPGYLFSARLLGTQIRKVEASWFGWAVTLCCYPPLMGAVFGNWLNFYGAGATARPPWMQMPPATAAVVGGLILLLEIIHYWGEAVFGLRASNLSNRGIITNGPYRFCKHPVYLVKCLGWLLVWMPFLAGDTPWECLRLTFLWAGVCGIYLMRAWVEERLLSDDPVYVDYARWMDKHALLAPLGRACPFFSYAWRLKHWHAQR